MSTTCVRSSTYKSASTNTGFAAKITLQEKIVLSSFQDTFTYSEHDNSREVRWTLREKGVVLAGPDPKEERREEGVVIDRDRGDAFGRKDDLIAASGVAAEVVAELQLVIHRADDGESHAGDRDGFADRRAAAQRSSRSIFSGGLRPGAVDAVHLGDETAAGVRYRGGVPSHSQR